MTHRSLQAASGAVLNAQHLGLSKSEETCSRHQLVEGVEEQVDVTWGMDTSNKASSLRLLFDPKESWNICRKNAT